MKNLFLVLGTVLFAIPAFSSEDLRSYFEKTMSYPGITLDSCGTDSGTSGIKSDKTQKACTGIIKTTKQAVLLVKTPGKAIEIMAITIKLTKGYADPDGGAFGERDWSVTMTELDSNLKPVPSKKKTHAKEHESWEYSDGVVTIEGTTPKGTKFSTTLDPMDEPIYFN